MSMISGAVHRPVTTIMGTLIVVLLGTVAALQLPVDLMPEVSYPTLTVRTSYPNVGPQEVEDLVTRPIENAVAAIAGVETITSTSSEGDSAVRVSFTWGTDLDGAAEEVRSRVDRIRGTLPEEADTPSVFKFDLAAFPIVFLGVASQTLEAPELRLFTEERIQRRLERVPGVASVDIRGGLRRQVQVNLDRDRMLALGLSADRITRLLREENLNRPAGKVEEGNLDLYLRTVGEYRTPEEIGSTVVAVREGTPIYLRDVAEVKSGVEETTTLTRIDGEPGIRLAINKQAGSNTVEVADGILAEMERLNLDFPEVRVEPIIDTSRYIRQAMSNVGSNALIGGVLATIVLFFFLRSFRSTLVIAVVTPISVLATLALVYFNGYTLNIMTFGGLALGVGMLLDNAVVVLENIFRKREEGLPILRAAVEGTQEVAAPLIATTITTMVVFLPIVFMRGMAGVMYRQLAVVVAFSQAASLVVGLTLIPVLAARLLARGEAHPTPHGPLLRRFYARSEAFLAALEERYRRGVAWALAHRAQVVGGAAALFVASLLVVPFIGSELMPQTDEGEVRINAEMSVGTKLEVMDKTFREIERVVAAEVPEARKMLTSIGGGGWRASGQHSGDLRVTLAPKGERERSSTEIADALRERLSGLPGVKVRAREGSGLFILNMAFGGGDEGLTVEVRGEDLEAGFELAERTRAALQTIPVLTDVRIARDPGRPERVMRINRDKLAQLGLSMQQVAEVIETNLAGSRATVLREAGREVDIVVRLAEPDRVRLADIDQVSLVAAGGESVPLRTVVEVAVSRGPVIIDREDQERVIPVTATLVAGEDLGTAAEAARTALRDVPVPDGHAVILGGEYEEQQKASRQLLMALALALLLVYMVMAAEFENLLDPFVVMFSVPMAAIGVFFTMWLTQTTFNIQSYIGMILLIGIVTNNAIVLIDYVNLLRRRDGMELHEAVVEGGRRRLRPILMTTAATVLGLIPLALGIGEGAEVQASMARVVIGGMTVSTLITLLLVPVVYTTISEWQLRRAARRSARAQARREAAEAAGSA
ncbi:MAG TPA: efflux RND transporter permease subunit [Thermoanaerobaculia bacterium]|nr:efflux RND transporter permease subunit [Thermoanaerobaculia bacterium]